MRKVATLATEGELNAVLKTRKQENFTILYHSLWCDWSKRVLALASEWKKKEGDEVMYLVNSWDLPQAFSTFSITNAPTLVHFRKGRITVNVEYPKVHEFFTACRRGKS
jgi:hypothetical protein